MTSSPEGRRAPAIRFAALDARVRAAVEEMAADDPNPADPFRGLYVSDGKAVALARAGGEVDVDERLAAVAARLGLDALDAAALGLVAAPELDPRYGRLFAYLHDDISRKLGTPRLVARLLAGEGVGIADVLERVRPRGGAAPAGRRGALRGRPPGAARGPGGARRAGGRRGPDRGRPGAPSRRSRRACAGPSRRSAPRGASAPQPSWPGCWRPRGACRWWWPAPTPRRSPRWPSGGRC